MRWKLCKGRFMCASMRPSCVEFESSLSRRKGYTMHSHLLPPGRGPIRGTGPPALVSSTKPMRGTLAMGARTDRMQRAAFSMAALETVCVWLVCPCALLEQVLY